MIDRSLTRADADNRIVRSRLLPGGDLVAAVLSRRLMILADRGGASGLVGQRWADVCADAAVDWAGTSIAVPDDVPEPFAIDRVARLDHAPEVAATASRRGLQNPDLLFIGHRDGRPAILAADAKFSVETARSKQVSPAVVAALLDLEALLRPLVGELPSSPELLPGLFLSPDYPLTTLMLQGRTGILRATVAPREVATVPVAAGPFFAPLEGATLMPMLSAVDNLGVRIESNLLAGLYYFRLARAAIGCWLDAVRPLLAMGDKIAVDEPAVHDESQGRAVDARSAFDLIQSWDSDVEAIRRQRAAVEQVAGLPVGSREIRTWIERATPTGAQPPSGNQVRRRLGSWHRAQIRERVGPLSPPLVDIGAELHRLGVVAAEVARRLDEEAVQIIRELAGRPEAAEGNGESNLAQGA